MTANPIHHHPERPQSSADFVGPSHCYSDPTDRVVQMALIKEQLKAKKITNITLAYWSNKTPGWVGQVLLGNFPFNGACCMPKNIATAIERGGIELPLCFRWPKATEEAPSERQLGYIAQLFEKAQREPVVPATKAEASALITELRELLSPS